MVISGVLALGFAIASIFALLVAGSIGSTCTSIQKVLNSTSPGSFFTDAGLTVETEIGNMLNECIPIDKTGEFNKLISEGFDNQESLLDGITSLENFTFNITSASNDMVTARETKDVWEYYKNGYYPNF